MQAWWVASFPDERHLAIPGLVNYLWTKRLAHNPGYFSDGGEKRDRERGGISYLELLTLQHGISNSL